jgi:heptosyltransferase-2
VQFRNILITRFSSLGDLVLTTPIYRELRRVFPEANLTLLTSEGFGRVLENNPHLDQIIFHPRKEGRAALQTRIQQLREQQFDLIYDAHDSLRSRWIRWQLQRHEPAPIVWKIDKRTFSRLLLLRFHWNLLRKARSQREQWLQPLVRYHGSDLDASTELFPAPGDVSVVQDWMRQHQLTAGRFVCVGAAASFPLKCWPLENYVAVIEQLLASDWRIVLVGGPQEVETEALAQRFSNDTRVVNAAGQFSILQSVALLEQARCVLCNDTSIAHMAESQKTPALVMFGPTVREFGYAPYLEQSHLIESALKLPCRPCSRTGKGVCKIEQKQHCLTSISPQEVLHVLEPMLN